MTRDEMKTLLRDRELRVTGARLDVLGLLAEAEKPLSFTSVMATLGEVDYAATTVYRTLVTLSEVGITRVLGMEGIDRYEFVRGEQKEHHHPHFVCEDCGRVECLPVSVTEALEFQGPWADSLRKASLQFKGECPDCLDSKEEVAPSKQNHQV
jgi:Fur family ferric uptake transcriptional regulator